MLFNAASNRRLVRLNASSPRRRAMAVGTEQLDRPRHRANLVSLLAPRHGEIGIASGEPVHQRRQSEHRPGDAASHYDRTEQDQHRSASAKTEQQMLRTRLPVTASSASARRRCASNCTS